MPTFTTPLDLRGNELRNARTQNLGTAPSSPAKGRRYYDTATDTEVYWNGARWVTLSDTIDVADVTGLGALAALDQVTGTEIAAGSILNTHISAGAAIDLSKLAVDPLDRANHTGTQTAATISNFDTQVRTSRLDQMATPTAPVNLGGQTIASLGTPSNASDAATKAYVDSVATGIDVHTAVRAASTANIDRASAPAAIDGVTLATNDRILLKDQTVGTENGIYTFASAGAALARSTDADASGELKNGTFVLVTAGTTNVNTGWIVTTPNPIAIGSTVITWAQFSSGGSTYTGTTDRIAVTGTQIDIAATYAGQASIITTGTITTGTWQATPIDIAYGGTGATSAAGARAALGTLGKYTTTIGDGASTTYTVTHNLGSTAVGVELWETATGLTVYADVTRTSNNAVRIDGFVAAPATGALGVVVWG